MENKMENKKRNFGFTAVKTTNEKLEEVNKPEVKEVIEGKKISSGELDITKIASNKIDAMEKFNLKPITKSGKYELEKDYYDSFSFLASRLNKDIQELASEYVFDCLKRDLKKFNIPVIKNN
jgi:hypothetical protein